MEMHMVHINSKYINEDGTTDPGYGSNSDGVAVLGFMFKVKKSEVNRVLLYKKIIYISLYIDLCIIRHCVENYLFTFHYFQELDSLNVSIAKI